LLTLGVVPGMGWGQAFPPQPEARKGAILDVSGDAALAAMPVARLTVDMDQEGAQAAARGMSAGGVGVTINPGPYRELDGQKVTMHLKDAPFMEGLMELRQQLRARISD